MNLVKVTIEEVLNSSKKDYNVAEWTKKVNRYAALEKTQFYFVAGGNGYDYDRYFVSYQIPNEFMVLSSFGYGSMLSNNSFCKVAIDSMGHLTTKTFTDKEGNTGFRISNNPQGRKYMTSMSRNFGTIFTNEF
jgi:hypothetical protein